MKMNQVIEQNLQVSILLTSTQQCQQCQQRQQCMVEMHLLSSQWCVIDDLPGHNDCGQTDGIIDWEEWNSLAIIDSVDSFFGPQNQVPL